ncbi:MAG: 23S rRNA (pseudouridine(1915)-N(3))-methyltransferase RlmH [Bacilli bacterium]|nr:23S rRNA (pseudouridine(1915)-N(3))-methyltransferase RlmH [Bacilli bacterium]
MIKIICVGKLKEKYLTLALNEYLKRISKYTKIDIIEVDDVNLPNIEINKIKEQEQILKYINKSDYVITLEIDGKQMNSLEFAEMIDQTFQKTSNLIFIIGGSYGLGENIKKISKQAISFSKLTFPHQLFRIILLEQIYRSYKINNNESYHK